VYAAGVLKSMATFKDIAKYVSEYDLNKTLTKVFQSENIQTWIIQTIKRRLYSQGITGSELKLKTDTGNPFYTEAYVRVKKRKGERTANVTLKLTGGFYESFKLVLIKNGWRIDAEWGFTAIHFKELYANEADFHQDVMKLTETEIDFIVENPIQLGINEDFNETVYRP
jgi:hypothetical protein